MDETSSDNSSKRTTKLHILAEKNDVEQLKQLLSQGNFDVNAKDDRDRTPLHVAAESNVNNSHIEVIDLLLSNGADLYANDDWGDSAIDRLINQGNIDILKLILKYEGDVKVVSDKGLTLLFPASSYQDNVDVVELLIDLGLDVNHRNDDGDTPLHWACGLISDNLDNVKFLLRHGANINAVNNEGATPITKGVWDSIIVNFGDFYKLSIKKMNFIMENTDFNTIVVHNDQHILTFDHDERLAEFKWKTILEHIAKLQSLSLGVHQALLNTISKRDKYRVYYKKCEEELIKAKSTKLKNSWVSFYNLLIDDRKKIKNYAGNEDLIKDFKNSDCVEKFPIYGVLMRENVEKGISRRILFDKSAILLSDLLPVFNPTHLIVKDTLDCMLSKKNLYKFLNCQ